MASKPKIQIPVHVAVWTVVFLPGVAYAYYWYKNAPTNEEFEETLRQNYSHNITNSREKHIQMNSVFQSMRDPNSDQQKKMKDVLMGGRGEKKRLYSVDETVYGTPEGKLSLEAAEKEMKKAEKMRKKKKKTSASLEDEVSVNGESTSTGVLIVKNSAIAVAVVGALAAGASFFLRGTRSQ